MLLALYAQTSLVAQEKAASSRPSAVSVPFVGCRSDGPSDPREAPKGTSASVPITPKAAESLAYYATGTGLGVLAPRSWYCYGMYGPGDDSLYVGLQPIDGSRFSIGRSGFVGPIIEVSHSLSNTGQRSHVAEIIARVFPAYMAFATHLMEEGTGEPLKFGPYPKDALTYRNNRMVEYKTPAQTDGLGTHSWLKKSVSPIEGVAMLVGPTPDLLLLSMRLPPELNGLTSVIVHQFEGDAERSDRH